MISQRQKGELARFYTVTDPKKHKKGYTVYKVTARIISRKNPEDIQEITVWKRYSDFRKLHRDLWQIHRNLFRHSELFPPFAKAKVFGRFDDSVVEERRQCSEDLLQFSANIPALYSSQHIEDFFKGGEVQDGSELIGPAEPFSDFLSDSFSDYSSEVHKEIGGVDDLTLTSQSEYGGPSSDGDLISLLVDGDSLPDLDDGMASGGESPNRAARCSSPVPLSQREAASAGPDVETSRAGRAVLFPGGLKKKKDYLEKASEQIRLAVQKETEQDFEAAFTYYRSGVDLLLQGVQGEPSPSQREAVKRKTAEYLMRAEQISSQHLRDGMGQGSTQTVTLGPQCCRRLWSHQSQAEELKSYRVIGVIDKVLLVIDKRTQETFILKGLQKSSECGRVKKTIVPHTVPNMVCLRKVIISEDTIFLLLQYAEGGKLWSHISKYLRSSSPEESFDIPFIQKSHTTAVRSAEHFGTELGSSSSVDSGPGTGLSLLREADGLHHSIRNRLNLGVGSKGSLPGSGATSEEECTNSYLTLCNEYEQEKVEPDALGEEAAQVAEEEQDTLGIEEGGLSVAATISVATPISSRTRSLLSSDSLCSPAMAQDLRFFTEDEEHDQEQSDVFSSSGGPLTTDSLDQSKRSPMEFFRIDSKDSASEVMCQDPSDIRTRPDFSKAFFSSSDLGSEVPESLVDLVDATVKGQVSDLWKFDSDQGSNESVPVISFKEALVEEAACNSVDDGRPPDLLVNLPAVGGIGVHALEEQNVSDGVSIAIEAKPSPKFGTPDVLQLSHDLGEEAEPDWSVEQSLPSISSIQNSITVPSNLGLCDDSRQEGDVFTFGAKMDPFISNIVRTSNADVAFSQSRSLVPLTYPSGAGVVVEVGAGTEAVDSVGDIEKSDKNVSQLFKELDQLSLEASQARIPEEFVRCWAMEMVVALAALHQEGIICRDLNPNNVLLNDKGHVQLTFFCSWTDVEDSCDRDAVVGMYCAPEVGGICEETAACDWWSLGAILFELLTGKSLQLCHPAGIGRHTFLNIPEFVSEEAKSLLQHLLQFNPMERLGAGVGGVEDIKSHPFFSHLFWPN
uniref:Ribosomal protein S6 kinase delta-1 n=1 Tax=Denticeps clupeoides TaxID=299321 RepID=A0AAY4B105_9TELE